MTVSPSLAPGRLVVFDGFRVDAASQRLWRGERQIALRPKSWDVLCFLIERPGLLVTKEALHHEIWRETAVSDDTLTKSIGELRRALGDNPRTPRFIETVHGRGFRFVATIEGVGDEPQGPAVGVDAQRLTATGPGEVSLPFVGRRQELHRLHESLRLARQGARQLVFITGEAGIGKTSLSEEFLRSPALGGPDVCVLRGQCIQQHGQREPYMPVLEALERLLSSPSGSTLVPLFRRVAPCWYVQIPWLLSEGEPGGFQGSMMHAHPERMLREIGTFLESLAAHSMVVLVLEDLHWSDNATIDLLSFFAERRDPARLLIIGTYRPAEASTHEHPIRQVKQTLRSRRRCIDIALDYLSVENVREYLHMRFGDEVSDLAPLIHERTDGNPLFVVAIVEELIRRGQLTDTSGNWAVGIAADRVDLALPDDLLEMVTAQFQSLSAEERSVLEAASVAGVSFAPWTVARALGRDAEEVEAVSQRMVRARLFLNAAGRTEDSGSGKLYDFIHALHHQVIYEQIPSRRCQRLHQTIGEALESTYGERLAEVAPELSVHFEHGGDHMRAAKYLGLCVAQAQQRLAPHEAIACADHALRLLERVPDTPDRRRRELELRLLLGVSLNVTGGYGAKSVRQNYERARTLCLDVGDTRQLFEIVHATWYAQTNNAELDAAQRTVDELARIAELQDGAEFRRRAELARGRTELWKGNFGAAVQVCTQFLEDVENQPITIRAETYGVDPVVPAFVQGALAHWFVGHPDRARAHARSGLAHAEKSRQPLNLASALFHSTILELLCGNAEAAARLAARTAEISAQNDVGAFRPVGRFFGGAARAEQGDVDGGLSEMLPALVDHRAVVGAHFCGVMLGFIASSYGRAERWDEGLRRADEGIGLTETSLERFYAAELWRVKGELLFGKARSANGRKRAVGGRLVEAARQCFRRALEIAGQQEARSLALRSAMSLTRLSKWRGGSHDARDLLRSLVASFTEGFDTKDLTDAKALLSEPGR